MKNIEKEEIAQKLPGVTIEQMNALRRELSPYVGKKEDVFWNYYGKTQKRTLYGNEVYEKERGFRTYRNNCGDYAIPVVMINGKYVPSDEYIHYRRCLRSIEKQDDDYTDRNRFILSPQEIEEKRNKMLERLKSPMPL